MRPLISALIRCMACCMAIAYSSHAFADGSAWLTEPNTGYFSLSYVTQSADDYYRQTCPPTRRTASTRCNLPGDLVQDTTWLVASYGISDSVAIDARIGHATSDLGGQGYSDLVDSTIGVTWRVLDETITDYPSVALRAGLIVAGGYETGQLTSLGDGGDGFEASVIAGKFVSSRVGVSMEVGIRDRGDGIPANLFTNLSGVLLASNRLVLSLDYRRVDSADGFDIGERGFTPDKFPATQEESELVSASAFVNLTDKLSASLVYGTVVDGRNTANSDIVGISLNYSFDLY